MELTINKSNDELQSADEMDAAFLELEASEKNLYAAEQRYLAAKYRCIELIKDSDPYQTAALRQWDNRGEATSNA